jgi:hypothetical protein
VQFLSATEVPIVELPTEAKEPARECLATVTKVRGATACGGQTIFEEDFSTLKEDIWRIEQYIPLSHPVSASSSAY